MVHEKTDRAWVEIVFLSLSSVLLYQFAIGLFVFLFPLQVLYKRRGQRFFLIALALTFGILAAVRSFRPFLGAEFGTASVFIFIEMFIIACLMGGLALVNLWRPDLGSVVKLIGATAATGLLSVPLIARMARDGAFIENIDSMFSAMSVYLQNAISQNSMAQSPLLLEAFQPQTLKLLATDLLYKSYLFNYFIILTFGWWAGSITGAKSTRSGSGVTKLSEFKLKDHYLWFFIGAWALVLITSLAGVAMPGALTALAWNAALLLLFLYGLQGIGIARFLMNKYHLSRGWRVISLAMLAILLLTPRINIVMFFLIPGIGISEMWIRYRKPERNSSDESDPQQ